MKAQNSKWQKRENIEINRNGTPNREISEKCKGNCKWHWKEEKLDRINANNKSKLHYLIFYSH